MRVFAGPGPEFLRMVQVGRSRFARFHHVSITFPSRFHHVFMLKTTDRFSQTANSDATIHLAGPDGLYSKS